MTDIQIKKYKIKFEHEIDKPAEKYTEEEVELLKKDYLKASIEQSLYLEYRRDEMYGDGRQLIKMLYSAMTPEEKMQMLRKKQKDKHDTGL